MADVCCWCMMGIFFSCLRESWCQTDAVWGLSGQFTFAWPSHWPRLRDRQKHFRSERPERVRCDICFYSEMWSLTCLSKPNTMFARFKLNTGLLKVQVQRWSEFLSCVSGVRVMVGGEWGCHVVITSRIKLSYDKKSHLFRLVCAMLR